MLVADEAVANDFGLKTDLITLTFGIEESPLKRTPALFLCNKLMQVHLLLLLLYPTKETVRTPLFFH